MNILEFINNNITLLDGGTGTLLQAMGLPAGELPERWNTSHPELIKKLHLDYLDAGSNVICTNTFGANALKFSENELKEIIFAAVKNARDAINESEDKDNKFVALDIGPSGKLIKPLGELDFEDAVELFAKTVRLGAEAGVDLIYLETFSDTYEAKAAILAAKENCELPIFFTAAFGNDLRLMSGATPAAVVALAEGLGVSALGANCGNGPEALAEVMAEISEYSSIPIIFKPNAGMPKVINGKTVYDLSPEKFAEKVAMQTERGVCIVGGCCGTTPDYIKALKEKIKKKPPTDRKDNDITFVSSYTHAVRFDKKAVLIGERINPTGKKKLKEALRTNDMDYILSEAILEEEYGADILDVNTGLPDIDEKEMLTRAVREIQSVSALPLEIDTASPEAMEKALRIYNGKPMINSVNGKKESMDAVFPLVKKYGGVVVALTLDENGIPENAEGRVKIARKILDEAEKYGVKKKDIVFDPLTLTVSADGNAASITLEAVSIISKELKAKTVLGVSNISFGLPEREAFNSAFFTLALNAGLSAAIMNPKSRAMMMAYKAHNALSGLDGRCLEYIEFTTEAAPRLYSADSSEKSAAPLEIFAKKEGEILHGAAGGVSSELFFAIIKGLAARACELTEKLCKAKPESILDIVKDTVIPALDEVGAAYEAKRTYLPSLLMSADAAKASFEVVKSHMKIDEKNKDTEKTVILATVKGDIHDIGKNIVKLLLENYGFSVIDLGRDVPPNDVLSAVLKSNARLVGLSALMTTTVPAMEETVRLIKTNSPSTRTVVGGAVLTKSYAEAIGADKYACDAMETVRYAEEIFSE